MIKGKIFQSSQFILLENGWQASRSRVMILDQTMKKQQNVLFLRHYVLQGPANVRVVQPLQDFWIDLLLRHRAFRSSVWGDGHRKL